jgi:hypothetical protein
MLGATTVMVVALYLRRRRRSLWYAPACRMWINEGLITLHMVAAKCP